MIRFPTVLDIRMPAIPLTNRNKLEGSGTGVEEGGGGSGGGFGPVGMNGITEVKGNKASQPWKELPAAATASGGTKEAAASSIGVASGILYSINTGCFFASG